MNIRLTHNANREAMDNLHTKHLQTVEAFRDMEGNRPATPHRGREDASLFRPTFELAREDDGALPEGVFEIRGPFSKTANTRRRYPVAE